METTPSAVPRVTDYSTLAAAVENGASTAASLEYTVEEAIESIGLGRFQYYVLALAGLCWTAESMEMLLLSYIKAPLQCAWNINDARAAFITTCVGIGMLIGAISWGVMADRFGRRTAFIASTAFTFIFGLISGLSVNYPMLLIARGAVGFGIGGVPVSFSLIMELLPAAQRGTWGMALAGFWSLGAIFESAVAMLVLPALGWRWLIIISSLPLAFVLILCFFVTESPRWLIARGFLERAERAVSRISQINGRALPPGRLVAHISTETPDIVVRNNHQGRLGGLLRPGARSLAGKVALLWFTTAFVYYGLLLLQPEFISSANAGRRCPYAAQECGVLNAQPQCEANKICSWGSSSICHPSGVLQQVPGAENIACSTQLTREDFRSTLWASVGELPGILVAFVTVDHIGRRPVLGYMFGLGGVMFVLLLGCIGLQAETIVFFVGRGASSGSFQAVYLYTNEVYPSRIRARAMGLGSSVARIGLILTPFVAQYLSNFNTAAALWIYFGASAAAVLSVLLIPIETTGRPLMESMDELIETLRNNTPNDGGPDMSFSKDPSAHPFIRSLRWQARVDGKA